MKPSTLLVAVCIILLAMSATAGFLPKLFEKGIARVPGLEKAVKPKSSKYDQMIEANKDRWGKYKRAKEETKAKQRDVKTLLKCLSKFAPGDFCSSCDMSNYPALEQKCINLKFGIRRVCFKNRPVDFKQLFHQRCPNRTPSPAVGAV